MFNLQQMVSNVSSTQQELATLYETEMANVISQAAFTAAKDALAEVFEEVQDLHKRSYLLALCVFPGYHRAAAVAGIHSTTGWAWRNGKKHESPAEAQAFAAGLEIARRVGVEFAENEAWRRSIEGVVEPVFGSLGGEKGENGAGVIGYKVVRSDSLLQFMLKGHDPKYSTTRTELSGPNGGPMESKVVMLPSNDREAQEE